MKSHLMRHYKLQCLCTVGSETVEWICSVFQFKKGFQLHILQIHTAHLDWPRRIMPGNILHDIRTADQQSYQKLFNKYRQFYHHNK